MTGSPKWVTTPNSRRHKKCFTLTLSDAANKQLDDLAVELDESRSAVVERAIAGFAWRFARDKTIRKK